MSSPPFDQRAALNNMFHDLLQPHTARRPTTAAASSATAASAAAAPVSISMVPLTRRAPRPPSPQPSPSQPSQPPPPAPAPAPTPAPHHSPIPISGSSGSAAALAAASAVPAADDSQVRPPDTGYQLPRYVHNYQKWHKLCCRHAQCCCSRAWPNEYPVVLAPVKPPPHPQDATAVSSGGGGGAGGGGGGKVTVRYVASILVSRLLRDAPVTHPASSPTDSKTSGGNSVPPLYVNWTNYAMPGYGWLGSVVSSSERVDDADELELFWNSDVALSVRPDHPSLAGAYPLRDDHILLLPRVTLLGDKSELDDATSTTVRCCASREIAVANVPFLWKTTPEPAEQKLQISRALRRLGRTLLTGADGAHRHVALSIGRFMRCGFDPLFVSHAIARALMPLLQNGRISQLEILVPDPTRAQTHSAKKVATTTPTTATANGPSAGPTTGVDTASVPASTVNQMTQPQIWHHHLLSTLGSYVAK